MKTLIIIDVQNDFMPGGALEVPKGDLIVPVINRLQSQFELIVATQDWHPSNHISFASHHPGKKPFEKIIWQDAEQTLWPEHCIQGSIGAEFHNQLDTRRIETIFRKGTDPKLDSYSGFYDNGHYKSTGLAGYLREKGAQQLYFCGLCAEICVYYTIKDALEMGFDCTLLEAATHPLDRERFRVIKSELLRKNVKLITNEEIT